MKVMVEILDGNFQIVALEKVAEDLAAFSVAEQEACLKRGWRKEPPVAPSALEMEADLASQWLCIFASPEEAEALRPAWLALPGCGYIKNYGSKEAVIRQTRVGRRFISASWVDEVKREGFPKPLKTAYTDYSHLLSREHLEWERRQ